MKSKRAITATQLAECCVCEQRVVFDHLRGRRRTQACQRRMQEGTAVHARLHRDALREMPPPPGDGRCFVATALWGPTDPRTQALREWRDRWLLKRAWGRGATWLYYRLSPRFIGMVGRTSWLRAVVDRLLSAMARHVARQQG